MSVNALIAVLKHSRSKGSEQLVLLRLADLMNEKSGNAWPGYAHLAKVTGLSRKHVMKCAKASEASGELKIVRRSGLPNHFSVNVGEATGSPTSAVQVTSHPGDTSTLQVTDQCRVGDSTSAVQVTLSSYDPLKEQDKREPASLRSADIGILFSQVREADQEGTGAVQPIHPNRLDADSSPRVINGGMPTPDKEKSPRAPLRKTTYPHAWRQAPLSELPGFPIQKLVDLWNAIPHIPRFEESLTPELQQVFLRRMHEQPILAWWEKKLADIQGHKYLCGLTAHSFLLTLPGLLSKRHWEPLTRGEYASKRNREKREFKH